MNTKNFTGSIQKASSKEYDAEFIISSTSLDRDLDNFSAKALEDIAKKTKKLICLYQHKSDAIAGYWENIQFDGTNLTASLKLATTNLGLMLKKLIDENIPLAASVGFGVEDYDKNEKGGYVFNKADMHECSLVSTPSNRDAQRIKLFAKQFGFAEEIFTEPSKCLEKTGKSADEKTLNSIKKAKLAILNANKLNRRLK